MNRFSFVNLLILLVTFGINSCSFSPEELKTAERIMETSPDSALHILRRINTHHLYTPANKALYALLMSQALDKNDIKVESDSIISIATNYYTETDPVHAGYAWFYHARTANNRGKADEQAYNLLKSQEFAEKADNKKLLGLVYSEKGIMYKTQHQYDSSIFYFKRAYTILIKIPDYRSSILILIHMGSNYISVSKFDSALFYFHKVEKMAVNTNDLLLYSTIYRSLGSVYLKQHNYAKALDNYYKVPLTKIEKYDSNKWILIANVFINSGNTDSTIYYLKKISDIKEMSTNYYDLWLKLEEKKGNYKAALTYAKKIIDTSDSINKRKLEVSFAGLEKKYKYQGLQIANQTLIIKNKQKGQFLLCILLAFSVFFVLVLFWRLRVKKIQLAAQTELLEKETAIVEIEKEKVEKEKVNITLLEKQLKLHAVLLLNIEQHRKNSIKRPGLWKEGSKETISEQNSTFYKEVITFVDFEHNNFSLRLSTKYPLLSASDILISCLLLAGFDSGMIATILDVKIESIIKHRYRLRTKLNLQNAENLLDYFRHFI